MHTLTIHNIKPTRTQLDDLKLSRSDSAFLGWRIEGSVATEHSSQADISEMQESLQALSIPHRTPQGAYSTRRAPQTP